jgi:hypothetical protein
MGRKTDVPGATALLPAAAFIPTSRLTKNCTEPTDRQSDLRTLPRYQRSGSTLQPMRALANACGHGSQPRDGFNDAVS